MRKKIFGGMVLAFCLGACSGNKEKTEETDEKVTEIKDDQVIF